MNKPKITFGAIKLSAPALKKPDVNEETEEAPATSGDNKTIMKITWVY